MGLTFPDAQHTGAPASGPSQLKMALNWPEKACAHSSWSHRWSRLPPPPPPPREPATLAGPKQQHKEAPPPFTLNLSFLITLNFPSPIFSSYLIETV